MTIIRCTAKLLKEMGLGKTALEDNVSIGFDEWYAHLFFLRRRKCVIFAHVRTLYAVIAHDVKRRQIKQLDELFRDNLGRRLYEDGFGADVIKRFQDAAKTVSYGRTRDRSVLGSINQMIFEFSNHMYTGNYGTEETLKAAEKRPPNSLYKKNGQYITPVKELRRAV